MTRLRYVRLGLLGETILVLPVGLGEAASARLSITSRSAPARAAPFG